MAEGIKVFFSYSHRDEQLRDELAKHLSAMRRQGVIAEWHDRKITAGNEWASEIDENLNKAHIILLLISPDFIASDYCYDIELKRAMERHDAGEARVIPIIIRAVDWDGAPFSKLQALPKDSKPVAQWKTLDDGFFDVAKGIRTTIQAMTTQAPKLTPAKKEPPTLIVDQMHRGNFATISEAIKAAEPGDRILVRPGLYQEGLVIDKPLEIVGDGDREDIIVQIVGRDVVLFRAAIGRIANLTLRQLGGGYWSGVDIMQGRLVLEQCDITSQSAHCVLIGSNADPRISKNRIHGGRKNGLSMRKDCSGVIEGNDIFDNWFSGVVVREGANPIVRQNRIFNNKKWGVFAQEGSFGLLEHNDIFSNFFAGVVITTTSSLTLRHNKIYAGRSSGVYILENGQGILEGNDIFQNAYSGVEVKDAGTPRMYRNRVNKNGSYGVMIYRGSHCVFEDNDLRDNTEGAWNIDASSLPNVIRRNNTPNE